MTPYALKHIENKICISCLRPAEDGHIYCQFHRSQMKDRSRRSKEKKVALGICISCCEPATHWRYCKKHWLIHKESKRRYYRKRSMIMEKSGRCSNCGAPLDPDSDDGCKSCITCRERVTISDRRSNYK